MKTIIAAITLLVSQMLIASPEQTTSTAAKRSSTQTNKVWTPAKPSTEPKAESKPKTVNMRVKPATVKRAPVQGPSSR